MQNVKLNKMFYLKYQNMPSVRVWGLKTSFLSYKAQKIYQAISREPYFQYSQTRPHFIQNPKSNLIICYNVKMNLKPGVWDLKTSFASIGPKRFTKP